MAGETPFSTKKLSFLTAFFGAQLGVAKLATYVRIEKIDRFGASLSAAASCTTLLASGFQLSVAQQE